MQPTQLDPQVVSLSKAIRETESQGNWNAKGGSGEWGAYQFTPDTWAKYAQEAGVNAQFGTATPDQQNQVAYTKIKQWKDQGYNPGQIASMWNAGGGKPNAYIEGNKGVNAQGVAYDTSEYARKVAEAYHRLKGDAGAVGAQVEQKAPTFLNDAGESVATAGKKLSGAVGDTLSGKINPVSGLIQGVGAVAGGVNDLTTNVLEHTPVVGTLVKGAEGLIGKGVEKVAGTRLGQSVQQDWQTLKEQNPELANDIAAGVEILTAIPILKGLGAGKRAIQSGIRSGLRGGFEDVAAEALTTTPKLSEVKSGIKKGLISFDKKGATLASDAAKLESKKYLAEELKKSGVPKDATPARIAKIADDAADAEARNLENMLGKSDVQYIVQPEDLQLLEQNTLQRAGTTLTSGENPAKQLLQVFQENLPKTGEITASDILKARRALSKFIVENRGDWSMRGVMTGFKSARNAIWDETRDLLARMAPDVPVMESLAKQAALYRVTDYIAPKVLKEIKDAANSTFMKRHPVVRGLVKGGGRVLLEGTGIGAVLRLMD